ncbi:MAG: hypothetical protein Ta2B_14420 [Termitinemataceae bacterium]|nr:MAG: hypothetical protein Ta2B_14420 [Termitinemataceae bacterium]
MSEALRDKAEFINWFKNLPKPTPEELAEEARLDAEIEAQKQKEARIARIRYGHIPARFQCANLATMAAFDSNQKKVVDYLVSYAKTKDKENLIMFGDRGTGKTYMASALIAEVGGQYWTAAKLFKALRSTYSKKAQKSELEKMEEFQKLKFLVIDEIGRQGGTNYESETLFELIDGRYSNMLPTMIITNLPMGEDFMKYMGAAVMDRMNERMKIIPCKWGSWRKKIAEGAKGLEK